MTGPDFYAALDEVVNRYMAGAAQCATPRLAALRSPRAAWQAVITHAEHRAMQAHQNAKESAT